MGVLNSQPLKSWQLHIAKLTLIKKSHLGTHYRDKSTNQQFLLLESLQNSEIENGSLIQYIKYHFKDRLDIRNKYIPEVLEYKDNFSNFCKTNCGFSLIMRHPTKSIEQEIVYRKQIKQKFGEGQIWNIIYSVLKAMIDYDILGYNINLNMQNIYISHDGDVIVSDAYLYSSAQLLMNANKSRLATKNIERLLLIVNMLMQEQGSKQKYSPILSQLLKALAEQDNHNYRKACSQVIFYKCGLDKSKHPPEFKFKQNVHNEGKEQKTNNIYDKFNELRNSLAQITNKGEIKKTNLEFVKDKIKFAANPSLPLSPSHLINAQTATSVQSKVCQLLTSHNEETKNVKPFCNLIQNLRVYSQNSQQDEKSKENITNQHILEQKNRYFLQTLIKKQANMIPQVSESDLEQSSIYSRRTQSRNLSRNISSYQEYRNLDSVNESEETGQYL